MTRPFPLRSEIVDGADEPAAEKKTPIAIGDDARRERLIFADQPASEGQSIHRAVDFWEEGRECGFYFFAGRPVIAALEDERLARRVHVLHDHGSWNLRGQI